MATYLGMWKRGLSWSGRTSRAEFWAFVLVNLLLASALTVSQDGLFPVGRVPAPPTQGIVALQGRLSSGSLLLIICLIPTLAGMMRRLQDAGRTRLWCCLAFVPMVGWFALGVLLLLPSAGSAAVPERVRHGAAL